MKEEHKKNLLLEKIRDLKEKIKNSSDAKAIAKYNMELYQQEKILFSLEQELCLYNLPVKSDGVVDLREYSHHHYFIYPCGSTELAGRIKYADCPKFSSAFGDVSYYINSNFTGKNYAYYALILLSEILFEEGVENFLVAVYEENIPSVKTIEKYGGKIIKKENNLLLYELKTRLRKDTNKKR